MNNPSSFRMGGRFMMSASSFSDSNTIEQAGSMISSRKTICTGSRTRGMLKSTGMRDMPAIGTWTERMYAIAFFRLSKILLPSRTAETIDVKLSSSRTREEASRATSVPLLPMAMPISADLRAGASLTPSPVIATTSPSAFRASTIRSFCSGKIRANIVSFLICCRRSSFVIASSSAPVMQ